MNRYIPMRLVLLIISLAAFALRAQNDHSCIFHVDNSSVKYKIIQDSTGFSKYITKAINAFALEGYVGLTIADTSSKNGTTHFYLTYQKHFQKVSFFQQVDSSVVLDHQVKGSLYAATENVLQEKLKSLENTGYPFAQVKVVNIREKENELELTYEIDSGDFFIIDKITIKSKEKFHEPTLLQILNLEAGIPYSEERIIKAQDLLELSGLYELMRPIQVVFTPGKAQLFIYIERKNASDADGFVGFQQNQTTGKLALNGFLNLDLKNAFNRSEEIALHWKNNPNQTQNLRMLFELPYIAKTPIGAGTRINLQKQDSSFVRADAFFELSYLLPYARFGIYLQTENSSTLIQTSTLNLRDYKKHTYGANLSFNPFLSWVNFYHPHFEASGGFFRYRTDSLEQASATQSNYKYVLGYSHIIDAGRYFHISNGIRYEGLKAGNDLSRNELIFFGGLRSIRGFYELELTGNDVIIINNEFIFQPVESLSLKLLYDYGSYHFNGFRQIQAVGVGFSFFAGNFELELIMANGWNVNSTPAISNSKIHLGFKSVF